MCIILEIFFSDFSSRHTRTRTDISSSVIEKSKQIKVLIEILLCSKYVYKYTYFAKNSECITFEYSEIHLNYDFG